MAFSVKRLLGRGLGRLKRRKVYYFRQPEEDRRNQAARTLDLAVVVVLLFLVALIFFREHFSFGAALPLAFLSGAAAWAAGRRYQKRQDRLRRQRYLLWLAGVRCREEIKKLKTREEIAVFVSLLLAQLPEFSGLRVNRRKGKKTPAVDEAMALSAVYRGAPVGVQCLPPSSSPQEGAELVRKFCRALEEKGMEGGLIVSPAEIHPELRRQVGELRKRFRIVFLNEEKLVELALLAGRQKEVEISPGGAGAGGDEKGNIPAALFGEKKAARYFLSACFLWIVHFLSSPPGFLGRAYTVLIAANLALALFCFVFQRLKEEGLDLEELQPGGN